MKGCVRKFRVLETSPQKYCSYYCSGDGPPKNRIGRKAASRKKEEAEEANENKEDEQLNYELSDDDVSDE